MTMQQRRNEANTTSSQISQREREINKFIRKRFGQKQILKSSGFATGHRKPSGKAFRQKAQSAMEYLMTYGWAILIIAIVLVAFFSLNLFNPYTFSPKASPGSCQILRPNGPGSNLFVSEVGLCNTNEIPQYVAQFNGADYINMGNVDDITGTQISIFIWNYPFAGQYSYPTQVSRSDYQLGSNETGTGTFEIRFCMLSACPSTTPPNTISSNTWSQVGITYNGSIVTFYINGHSAGSVSASGSLLPVPSNLTIGIARNLLNPFSGQISNVQIYNTSFSPSAVNTLYTEGIGGTPIDLQHLVGWWPLNGNSNDYSGNGNNGVPTNVIFTSSWENGYSSP